MKFLLPLILIAAISLPIIIPVYKGVLTGKKAKKAFVWNLITFCGICLCFMAYPFLAVGAEGEVVTTTAKTVGDGLSFIAAALSVGLSGLGAGLAVGPAASAAIGATGENPQVFAKALVFVAFAEAVALYGFIIAIQIIGKI